MLAFPAQLPDRSWEVQDLCLFSSRAAVRSYFGAKPLHIHSSSEKKTGETFLGRQRVQRLLTDAPLINAAGG